MKKSLLFLTAFLLTINALTQSLVEIGALESKIESLQEQGKNIEVGALILELGDLYRSNGEHIKAEEQYKNAVNTFEDSESWELKIRAYDRLGKLHSINSRYKDALEAFLNSLRLAESYAPKRAQISAQIECGITYDNLKKSKNTLIYLENSALLAEEIKDVELSQYCYRLLINASRKYKKIKKTIAYLDKYHFYNNLLNEEEKESTEIEIEEVKQKIHQKNLDLINSSLELYENKVELKKTEENLNEEKEINEQHQNNIDSMERERKFKDLKIKALNDAKEFSSTITKIVFGIVFLVIGVAAYIYYIFRQQVKRKRFIRGQKRALEKQHALLEDQHHKITSSINYAQRIQEASLPTITEIETRLKEQFILFKPRDVVSGDFYWFYNPQSTNLHSDQTELKVEHTEQEYLISAVDCTGHGVPGAFMSMIGFSVLNRIVSNGELNPALILNQLHSEINADLKQSKSENVDGMDMVMCSVDEEKKELIMAGAKNSLIYIQEDELHFIKGDVFTIGGTHHGTDITFTNHTVKFDKPTTFYMFSDGYVDQFGGPEDKKFMSKRFKNILLSIHKMPLEEQKEYLNNTINEWMGEESNQIDDILVWGFKLG